MSDTVPFACGTQYDDWTEANCEGCKKAFGPLYEGGPWEDADMECEIERALFLAWAGDGRIPSAIGERMGCARWDGHYNWPCPERDPKWKEVRDGEV
jgi:hypothetical protein